MYSSLALALSDTPETCDNLTVASIGAIAPGRQERVDDETYQTMPAQKGERF